jgi:hypothetical protein
MVNWSPAVTLLQILRWASVAFVLRDYKSNALEFGAAKEGDVVLLSSPGSTAAQGCGWAHVDKGVDLSLDCNRTGRWLKMRLSSTVELMAAEANRNDTFRMGLYTSMKVWNYRRAFTRCLGARVSRNNPKFRSTAVQATFVSASTYQVLKIATPCVLLSSNKVVACVRRWKLHSQIVAVAESKSTCMVASSTAQLHWKTWLQMSCTTMKVVLRSFHMETSGVTSSKPVVPRS